MNTKIGTPAAAPAPEEAKGDVLMTDTQRLDRLQELVVDTIYFDDGWIIDVAGRDLRKSIDAAIQAQGSDAA